MKISIEDNSSHDKIIIFWSGFSKNNVKFFIYEEIENTEDTTKTYFINRLQSIIKKNSSIFLKNPIITITTNKKIINYINDLRTAQNNINEITTKNNNKSIKVTTKLDQLQTIKNIFAIELILELEKRIQEYNSNNDICLLPIHPVKFKLYRKILQNLTKKYRGNQDINKNKRLIFKNKIAHILNGSIPTETIFIPLIETVGNILSTQSHRRLIYLIRQRVKQYKKITTSSI
jgi:hypothetical protein